MTLPVWKTCPACGAQIARVATSRGKVMPVDPDPDAERGNVRLSEERLYGLPVGDVLGTVARVEARESGEDLYVSHFATCSDPTRFRSEP